MILRIDEVPGWAGGSPASADLGAVEEFYAAMAALREGHRRRLRDPERAEPAVRVGRPARPGRLHRVPEGGLSRHQAGDPGALVIGGGPSPNTGGFGGTIEDTDFLQRHVRAGAKGLDGRARRSTTTAATPRRSATPATAASASAAPSCTAR